MQEADTYQRLILVIRHDLADTILDRVLVRLDESIGRTDKDRQGLQEVAQLILRSLRFLLVDLQIVCKRGTRIMARQRTFDLIGRILPRNWQINVS